MHRILIDPADWPEGVRLSADGSSVSLDPAGAVVTISGDEAHHAIRVKRLDIGSDAELLDATGTRALGVVIDTRKAGKRGWAMDVRVDHIDREASPEFGLRVVCGVPKGPRLDAMIESLSQVGVCDWRPLRSARSIVDPREGKLDRMARIATESVKQCGRWWPMQIGPAMTVDDAIASGDVLVFADADGRAPGQGDELVFQPDRRVTVIVGPEGGLNDGERSRLRDAGAFACCIGPHTLRTETAAVVAAASILMERWKTTGAW